MDFLIDFFNLNDVQWVPQIVNIIWNGSLYSLFALGYALIFSVLGVLNLAHSAIFMWGAYVGLWAVCGNTVFDGQCPAVDVPVWWAIPAAMIGGGIIAILVDRIAFYPLRQRNAPRLSQLISSIGIAIMMVAIAELVFGKERLSMPLDAIPRRNFDIPDGLSIENPLDIGRIGLGMYVAEFNILLTPVRLQIIVVSLILMIFLGFIVTQTRLGQGMRTVAFSERVSSLLGVHVDNIYMIAFFISGALAGAAGMLYTLNSNVFLPSTGSELTLKGLTVIVLGGLGSIRGAVLGGYLVAAIEVYMVAATDYGGLADAVVFFLFFLVLMFRPQGILGQPLPDRA
ncbi:MAG: hypothetical protein CUN55_01105 [Phototrophicales bacterium]|nr:MAG: hypothetical protein CUN55_01105 [Phototrophicales bacterium]